MKKLLACVLCSMILAGCSDPQVTYVQSNLFNVVHIPANVNAHSG